MEPDPTRDARCSVVSPWLLSLCLLAPLAGCVRSESFAETPTILPGPEEIDLTPPSAPGGATIGLEAEPNESDSLERLEALPGVLVTRVEPTGPAAAVGLRPGDVLLSLDSVETNDPDALAAVLRGAVDGQDLRATVRRGTVVFEATVAARASHAVPPPRELCRVDPVRSRAGFRTERSASGELAVVVARLDPGSPLADAGIRPGDRIVALDGRPPASAQNLVTRLLEEHGAGDDVLWSVARAGERRDVRVELHAPPRRTTQVSVLPLFDYRTDVEGRRTEFTLIDLWILSLFHYEREEGEREWRLFTLIRFGSGQGELVEESATSGGGS